MQKDSHQLTRVWKCDRICNSQGLRHAAALGQFARSDGVLTLTKDQSYRIKYFHTPAWFFLGAI